MKLVAATMGKFRRAFPSVLGQAGAAEVDPRTSPVSSPYSGVREELAAATSRFYAALKAIAQEQGASSAERMLNDCANAILQTMGAWQAQ
eukprot:15442492-Alexandrium_andersonii.AAC.1